MLEEEKQKGRTSILGRECSFISGGGVGDIVSSNRKSEFCKGREFCLFRSPGLRIVAGLGRVDMLFPETSLASCFKEKRHAQNLFKTNFSEAHLPC